MRHATIAALAASLLAAAPSAAATLAILPVKFLDTSNEPRDQTREHAARQQIMTDVLAGSLPGTTVLIDPAAVAAACSPETPDCLFRLAGDSGADQALFIVIHKSSTLIIQMFATLADPATGKVVHEGQLSFRGDTDESWRMAAQFLVRELQQKGLATN